MIEMVKNNNNTRFAVIVNGKLIVSTKSLEYAKAIVAGATNNDLSLVEKTFKPITFNLQDSKTVQK